MKTIKTDITINAVPEKIWDVLTDFKSVYQKDFWCKRGWRTANCANSTT